MSDYQQIPGSIRSLLATKSQTWTNHAADLATQYAQLCDDTNQRLRRCAEYLRRGMTSAAIHLADCQPNLVQAVGSLRFPERAAWADLCVNHGMPAPAVLEADCLDQLNAAYEREKTLQPLLSRHRLLAIAKAPAQARLEVTRMLAGEDRDNPAWPQEIRALELVRLDEIEVEARTAVRDRNNTAIESLWDELNARRWLNEIPRSIHDPLEQATSGLKARRTRAELPALAAELSAAFRTDPPSAELGNLVKKWKEKIATLTDPVPPDLAAQVKPALDWEIAEQRRKLELQEVKPLQYLFESSSEPKAAKPNWGIAILLIATVAILGLAAAAGYYYVHYMRK